MNTETFIDNVRTMQGGKVEIPPDVQKILGVSEGSRVTFIADGEYVRIVNPAIYAIRELQKAMEGAAEEVGWKSDDDVVEYIMAMRRSKHNTKGRIMDLNAETFTENVSIIQDDKVVIPSEMQKILRVSNGRSVMFIADGEEVRMVNPALYALRKLQEAMKGAAEEAGLYTEDDVVALVKEVRAELAEERAAKKDESVYRHEYSDFVHSMA